MPYTVPDSSEFICRHPRFSEINRETITAVITDAARNVDTTWFEDDFQPAIMYLTAHYLVMEGHLGDAVNTAGLITSEKLGDASVSYGNAVAETKSVADYGSTSYGRRFQDLLGKNHPAVLTA
jgi:hypothetical protein